MEEWFPKGGEIYCAGSRVERGVFDSMGLDGNCISSLETL